jgi:Ca-activated chloride channel family protein
MRHVLLTFFCLIAWFSLSQSWTDSLNQARKLYLSGDYSGALDVYKNLEKTQPTTIDLSNEIGQAAYRSGDFDTAADKFNAGLKNKKKLSDKAATNHNLGNTMMGKKNYQDAVNYYKEALKNNPEDEETRYNLSEAIRQLQKQNNPNNENNENNNSKNNDNKSDNKNKDQSQNNKSKNQNNQNNPADKPNNSVERLLDQLNKKDAANNRKYDKKKGEMLSKTKDW